MRIRIREDDDALCASSSEYAAGMFARDSSTRGQMRSPSIAQRGEGGARGGSGKLGPTAQGKPEAQRDASSKKIQASAFALSASVVNESAKYSSSGRCPKAT